MAPEDENGVIEARDAVVVFNDGSVAGRAFHAARSATIAPVAFDRQELSEILNLYGRMVACGEWRDYALDFTAQRAVFSIFRRTSETPLYRIVKDPRSARRQGAYSVLSSSGLVLKRGHDLARVLSAIAPRPRLVVV